MESPWRATLHKGDMVRIPQNTFLWQRKEDIIKSCLRLASEPLYGLIEEEYENECSVLLNGESWMVSKNYLYPGS